MSNFDTDAFKAMSLREQMTVIEPHWRAAMALGDASLLREMLGDAWTDKHQDMLEDLELQVRIGLTYEEALGIVLFHIDDVYDAGDGE